MARSTRTKASDDDLAAALTALAAARLPSQYDAAHVAAIVRLDDSLPEDARVLPESWRSVNDRHQAAAQARLDQARAIVQEADQGDGDR